MSIQSNFPAIAPTLNLSFALTKALDPRITFSRTSTATYYGTQTAKAEENFLTFSQAFDNNSGWSPSGIATRTADNQTAPDGTQTAETIVENTATGVHRFDQTPTQNSFSVTGLVTLSVFAKLGTGTRFLTIAISDNANLSNSGSATFDLSLGTNTQTQANGAYSGASATITAVAQGFYRCTLTVTASVASFVRIALNDTGTPTNANRGIGAGYTGDDTSSLIFWGAQLEQRSAVTAYTPTTTQAITNYIPVLQTAASGVARFDHNPTTFESLGLLIEEQRTNLVTYSEEFDNAAWTKSRLTITANTVIAPDGALTGDKLVETTETGVHQVLQGVTCTSGVTYTYSCYVKAAERTSATITLASTAFPTTRILVNISAKTISTDSGTPVASSVSDVGGGWLRVSVTQTATATGNGNGQTGVYNGANSYTGDGYSGIYIWGAQLEAGAFPTSYIQTVASQVTRSADAASMTGTNFSSWYNQAAGTLYAEHQKFGTTTFQRVAGMSDGGFDNPIAIGYGSGSPNNLLTIVSVGAVTQAQLTLVSPSATNINYKAALAYAVNDFASVANAGTVQTDTSGTIPVVSRLNIGVGDNTSANPLNGHIRKVAYYPIRCTNAQLQGLTS
jgi:hypothetical protein